MADVFEEWSRPMADSAGETLYAPRDAIGPFLPEANAARTTTPVTMDRARLRLFDLIRRTHGLDWLVLTKRPERVVATLADLAHAAATSGMRFLGDWLALWAAGTPPANVWLGTSVENQRCADERIPHLLQCPARVRFLSCEPLLDSVDMRPWLEGGIHWAIVGGESGPSARPCHTDDVRDLVEVCRAARVPCFVMQLGAKPVACGSDQRQILAMIDRKGGDVSEFPADLRVREFPQVA